MADPQQMHGYAYANNSPITFADPDGLSPCRTPAEKQWCEDWKDGQETRDDSGGGSTGGGTPSGLTPQEQQALAQAQVVKKKSLMQVILEIGGAILLDVIGVTDVYNCVKGSIGSCISTVAGAFPWYKVGKGIKAVYRATKGVLKWIEQVKWADNVIKAAGDKIAAAEAAAAQAAKKADDLPDVAGRKQPTIKAADDVGAGGSCVGNSFTPDTRVLMADGSSKPIEDVKVGDEVVATDPETGKTAKRKVVATIVGNGSKNLVEITVNTGGHDSRTGAGKGSKRTAEPNAKSGKADAAGMVIATDGHPFWVQNLRAWVKAADLKPGMWLRTSAGTYVQITAVRALTRHQRVHNLTVNDIHTYYVQASDTPVLVHNCPASAGGSKPGLFKRLFGKKEPPAPPVANGTVRDLEGIPHDMVDDDGKWIPRPISRGILNSLSDEDLLKAVFTPDDGVHMTLYSDGVMQEGNHRMAELLHRAKNKPNSSITLDTPIYVDGW